MPSRSRHVVIASLLALAGVLCGFTPANDVGDSMPAPQVCNALVTTAYRSDHIALAVDECWAPWTRAASACIHSSVHTVTLDDPSDSIVVYAADDFGTPGATKPALNAAQCAQRHVTLNVARESIWTAGQWLPVASYIAYGSWSSSESKCYVWTNYKSVAIPYGTKRVRVTAQAVRQDGSYAGTQTLASYVIPGAFEPCWEP